jgi:type II secretory pathway component PulM
MWARRAARPKLVLLLEGATYVVRINYYSIVKPNSWCGQSE